MNTLSRFLAGIPVALLAVVATGAAAADEPVGPHAKLHIVSATSGIAAGSWINVYAAESCDQKAGDDERIANFHALARKEKTVAVPIGKRLYVLAGAEITPPVGAEVRKTRCLAMASFVPEDGKTYDIKHDLVTRNCPVEITLGGAPVATFQKHKPKNLCKEKF